MLLDLFINSLARDGTFAVRPIHIDGCTFSDEFIKSPLTKMTLQQEIKNSPNDNVAALINQLNAWGD